MCLKKNEVFNPTLQTRMNIVILDAFTANPGDLSWAELEHMGHLTVYDRTPAADTVSRCLDADIVLTNKVCLRRPELGQLPRLKYIGVLATGYNVVDITAASQRGIVVTNVPAYSTDSVAQMVFAHLLNVTNRTGHYARLVRQGQWSNSTDFCFWDTPLTELSGKTFGIVGLGHIGQQVAHIAQSFGMNVIAYTSKSASQLPPGVSKVAIVDLFSQSDILSLHCPLTPDTHHLVNARTLATMKPTAILINTGRGPLVDEAATAEALSQGRLAAFCADVLTEEPPRNGSPLMACSNAFITPHIAWATREARQRLIAVATSNVQAFLSGRPQNHVHF